MLKRSTVQALFQTHRSVWYAATSVIVWALVLLCALELVWFFREQPLGPDAGYYLMKARQVATGIVPHRDFFSLHPAGVFYLQAFYFELFGESSDAIARTMLVHHLVIVGLLVPISRMLFRANLLVCGLAAGLYLLALPLFESTFYTTEPLVGMWGFGGLALALALGTRELPRWDQPAVCYFACIAAGLLLGVGQFIKQVGLFYTLAAAVILLFSFRRWHPSAVLVGASGFGFVTFFILHPTALGPWFDQNFVRLFDYARGTYGTPSNAGLAGLLSAWRQRPVVLLILIGVVFAIANFRATDRGDGDARRRRFATVVLALASLAFLAPCLLKPYRHYYLFLLPFAFLAVVALLVEIQRGRRRIAVGTLLFWLLVLDRSHVPDDRSMFRQQREQHQTGYTTELTVAAWMREKAEGAGTILVLPDTPQYYYLAGFESPFGDYEYVPGKKHFDWAARRHGPTFVVDRGNEWLDSYREELRERGLVVLEREGPAEYWGLGGEGEDDP